MQNAINELSERIQQLCDEARISDRELRVLRHRMWCRIANRGTLSEIADRLKISREAARLADESALEKLRSETLLRGFAELLAQRTDAIWSTLSGGKQRLERERLKEAQLALDANDVFLILALRGSIENWVKSVAKPTPQFWQRFQPKKSRARGLLVLPDLKQLRSADVHQMSQLLEQRERCMAELEAIDRQLAGFGSSTRTGDGNRQVVSP